MISGIAEWNGFELSLSRRFTPPTAGMSRLAALLMGPQGAFITGADFLIDGGATASYFYGPLRPEGQASSARPRD